jgi:hypothetical protein
MDFAYSHRHHRNDTGGRLIDRQSAKTLLAVVGTAALLSGCDVGSVATGDVKGGIGQIRLIR